MDKYNKSIQHNWFHHATWGSPKRKNEGLGKVLWHSLTEDGKVERVDIQFGDKVYKTLINRNVKLGEAPSHGKPIILYDASSTGSQNYMNLVSEILQYND